MVSLLLAVAMPAAHANDPPPEPIRIAFQDRVAMALLTWAQSRGDFEREALIPEIVAADTESLDAVADGEIDLLAAGAQHLLQAAEYSIQLRGALVLGYSLQADAVVGRPGLGDVNELRGKRIAIVDDDSRGANEIVLANALQQRGLNTDRTTVVYLDEADAATAITSGDVQALVAGEPALGRLLDQAATTSGTLVRLADASRQPGIVADLLMGEELWLRRNKELVKRMIRVWNRVVRAAGRDPQAAATAVAAALSISPEAAATALDATRLFDTAGNIEILRGDYQKAFAAMSIVLERREGSGTGGGSTVRGVASANRFLDLAPLRQVARGR